MGGGAVIYSLQLVINCELLSAFNRAQDYRFDFWQFIYHTSGHHDAYPRGYIIHWIRDVSVCVWGVVVIRLGREQFVLKRERPAAKAETMTCPGCKRKTFADAYCRFCGFNLVTYEPSREGPVFLPIWKVTLLAYAGLSIVLLILNLVLIKLGLA